MKCPNCNSEITSNSKSRIILYSLAVLLLLFVSGGLFYWFEWRPSQIRKEAVEVAIEKARNLYKKKNPGEEGKSYRKEDFETYYQQHIRSKGLEK
ncbi:MAG: hypothetical protein V1709_06615 [Planctomycetota bacterium]